MSIRPCACKKCFFLCLILLRLDGPLPTVLGDILAVLGTFGQISFTKDVVYKFLEVFVKKKEKKNFLANRRGTVMVMRRAKETYK